VEDTEGERFPPEHLMEFKQGGENAALTGNFGDEFVIREYMQKSELQNGEAGTRFRIIVERGEVAETGVAYPYRLTFINMCPVDFEMEHGTAKKEYVEIAASGYIGQLADNGATFTVRGDGEVQMKELFAIEVSEAANGEL
jgi:hypothetical protein